MAPVGTLGQPEKHDQGAIDRKHGRVVHAPNHGADLCTRRAGRLVDLNVAKFLQSIRLAGRNLDTEQRCVDLGAGERQHRDGGSRGTCHVCLDHDSGSRFAEPAWQDDRHHVAALQGDSSKPSTLRANQASSSARLSSVSASMMLRICR